MKAKTRYNIRLSLKKGVRIRRTDINNLKTWYELNKETCSRNRIYLHDMNYFKAILNTNVSITRYPVEVELLIAEINNKPLAAMFLVYSGKRATYLYGASSSINRNYMGPYALQWEAVKRSKNIGCSEYDMFGIAPSRNPSHPLYGLYRFKTGFGDKNYNKTNNLLSYQ